MIENKTDKITVLQEIKNDYLRQMGNICKYHEIDSEKTYFAKENVENFFDLIIDFYQFDTFGESEDKNKTIRKGLLIEAVASLSKINVPISLSVFFESPIEFLLFSTLKSTMPQYLNDKMYIQPQYPVCDNKYCVDFALMKKSSPIINGKEGEPLVFIECDGYEYHYSDSNKAVKTAARSREIQDKENLPIRHYLGSEIYGKDCTKHAIEFWSFVENCILPKIKFDS